MAETAAAAIAGCFKRAPAAPRSALLGAVHKSLLDRFVSTDVSHNFLPSTLPSWIDAVHAMLSQVRSGKAELAPRPPLPIRKAITPDHLVSLEDGKPRALTRYESGASIGEWAQG